VLYRQVLYRQVLYRQVLYRQVLYRQVLYRHNYYRHNYLSRQVLSMSTFRVEHNYLPTNPPLSMLNYGTCRVEHNYLPTNPPLSMFYYGTCRVEHNWGEDREIHAHAQRQEASDGGQIEHACTLDVGRWTLDIGPEGNYGRTLQEVRAGAVAVAEEQCQFKWKQKML
jgi:hypothetical protein